MRRLFLVVAVWQALAPMPPAQAWQPAVARPSRMEEPIRGFLQDYLGGRTFDKTTRFVAAFVDLNGDGTKEAIVYLMGDWCGSGGCTTLILAREGQSWRVVTKITITRPPIRVLTGRSNGWRSIAVWVQGGDTEPGYEAELCFDGRSYPSNPSMPPARQSNVKAPGETVIARPWRKGTPLYP